MINFTFDGLRNRGGGGGILPLFKYQVKSAYSPEVLQEKNQLFQIFITFKHDEHLTWSSITAVILENVTKIYQIIVICNISSFIEL